MGKEKDEEFVFYFPPRNDALKSFTCNDLYKFTIAYFINVGLFDFMIDIIKNCN